MLEKIKTLLIPILLISMFIISGCNVDTESLSKILIPQNKVLMPDGFRYVNVETYCNRFSSKFGNVSAFRRSKNYDVYKDCIQNYSGHFNHLIK